MLNGNIKSGRAAATGSGAEAVAAVLRKHNVQIVFGVVGAAILPIYDVLEKSHVPRQIIAAHEHGAVHMAEGYARASGQTGVVLTSSGPSATNLVTGLANAMADSTPLLAITGQVQTSLLGQDSSQEADMFGLSMSVTKHSFRPQQPEQVASIIDEAFKLTMSGRKGPVLIDLPQDVALGGPVSLDIENGAPAEKLKAKPYKAHLAEACQLLLAAQRPLILLGGGIIQAEAAKELLELIRETNFPVASTLMGLSAIPHNHPDFLGMAGIYGLDAANLALQASDLILCLGSRLDDRITGKFSPIAPQAKLIQADIDEAELGKNYPVDVPLAGDIKDLIPDLLEAWRACGPKPAIDSWRRRIQQWQQAFPLTYEAKDGVIMPQQVVSQIGSMLNPEDVIVTGVGQNQMFTAQYYPFKKPRTFITSGGLGAMGFGLPAAIGAKLALPRRQVVCIDGDGSFLMTLQELTTAVRYRAPIVVAIMKNHSLGMIQNEEKSFYGQRRNQSYISPPPYDKVAQAFGALGRRVEQPEDLQPALDWALRSAAEQRLPVILDIEVSNEESRRPALPADVLNS